jgi:D-alanyl-D-alanine-carboxypeptidase/D-alanyl-D-alanine-endopeptidase
MEWRFRAPVRGLAAFVSVLAFTGAGCDGSSQVSRPAVTSAPVTTPTPPPAPPPAPSTRQLTRVFDAIHRRYAHEILGICMGAIDRQARAVKCYGRVSRDSSRRPDPTTLFQIGSLSKTFTATLLALRVKGGAVRLEDPVRQYLTQGDGRDTVPSSMTLLDLADHYSGLPRDTPSGRDSVPSLDQYLAAAGQCEAAPGCTVAPPGRRYAYSNYAYGVLGELLGTRDGFTDSTVSAWEQDNAANVTGPLGLSDTHSWFGWRALSAVDFDARRARATVGDPPRQASPPYFPPAPFADAAAGLYSSANDMVKWLSFSMGLTGTPELNTARPLLYDTPSLLRPRENPADRRRRVGLGWRADRHGSGASGVTCVYKDGLTRGFTASMIFVKGRGAGAFVMLNTEPENPLTPVIATDLVNSLPPLPRALPNACGAVR